MAYIAVFPYACHRCCYRLCVRYRTTDNFLLACMSLCPVVCLTASAIMHLAVLLSDEQCSFRRHVFVLGCQKVVIKCLRVRLNWAERFGRCSTRGTADSCSGVDGHEQYNYIRVGSSSRWWWRRWLRARTGRRQRRTVQSASYILVIVEFLVLPVNLFFYQRNSFLQLTLMFVT